MEAASASETLIPDYTALQPRRQPSLNESRMMNLNEYGRKWSWPVVTHYSSLVYGDWEEHEYINVAVILAFIRTRYLPDEERVLVTRQRHSVFAARPVLFNNRSVDEPHN